MGRVGLSNVALRPWRGELRICKCAQLTRSGYGFTLAFCPDDGLCIVIASNLDTAPHS